MNNTQSIIVYSNPMEQQLWESGAIFPIMSGALVFLILAYGGVSALGWLKWSPFSKKYQYAQNAVLAVAAVTGIGTIGYLLP